MRKLLLISLLLIAFFIALFTKNANSDIVRIDGCVKTDDMEQFIITEHKQYFSTIYEITNNQHKFLLLVGNIQVDGKIFQPTIELTECHVKSHLKFVEQIGSDKHRVDLE